MTRSIDESQWTTVIQPRRGWFDINFADLWRYRDLIMLFVRRDFVANYKQTILGPLWFLLQPLLTTLVFTVIFGKIASVLPGRGSDLELLCHLSDQNCRYFCC